MSSTVISTDFLKINRITYVDMSICRLNYDKWMAQVSSGEKLFFSRNDEKPLIGKAGPDQLGNDWILFNKERDQVQRNE